MECETLETVAPKSAEVPEELLNLKYHTPLEAKNLLVTLVGTGGTGGYVARDIVRCLSDLSEKNKIEILTIVFWDGDIVESKNLVRQNFIKPDIGRYKAEVLAERYSEAYSLPIISVTKNYDPKFMEEVSDSHFREVTSRRYRDGYRFKNDLHLLISCTDNNASRRQIYKSFYEKSMALASGPTYWIDAGNEKKTGQVICGYIKDISPYSGLPSKYANPYYPFLEPTGMNLKDCLMPFSVYVYPEILDETKDDMTEVSCAEQAVEEPQNMFVNLTAATYVLNFVRQILFQQKMFSYGIEFNINGVSKALRNTPEMCQSIVKNFNTHHSSSLSLQI